VAQNIPMYQGEDFSQELSYFSDVDMTIPLVFTYPVMDVRDQAGTLLARFDISGTQLGLATITAPGVLLLTMPYTQTALIPAATYKLDIFADVAGKRDAITKQGVAALKVSPRNTIDTGA
jgi:hypothetical protein